MLAYQQRGKSRTTQRLSPERTRRRSLHGTLRRGVTLIEMMVAITITLIMIIALTEAFERISTSVSDSRAMITLTESTRKTAMILQRDLDGLTVPARPWPEAASGLGYLEIVEGYGSDLNPQPTTATGLNVEQQSFRHLLGDFDDLIMFTSRSKDEPFVGRIQERYLLGVNSDEHQAIDSPLAEVIWWTNFDSFLDDATNPDGIQDAGEEETTTNLPPGREPGVLDIDTNETIVLRRRALLIRPDLNNAEGDLDIEVRDDSGAGNALLIISQFLANNDISVSIKRRASNNKYYLAANSLADLTRRENRTGHQTYSPAGVYIPVDLNGNFSMNDFVLNRDAPPFLYRVAAESQTATQFTTVNGISTLTADAVMLGNVLAFDIKVYDPLAPIFEIDGVALAPTTRFNNDPSNPRVTYPDLNNVAPPGNPDYVANPGALDDGSGNAMNYIGNGEFVDLNYANGDRLSGSKRGAFSLFSGGHAGSGIGRLREQIYWKRPTNTTGPVKQTYPAAFTYDTWSWDYEHDGFDQNRINGADEGTDGLDTNSTNGVDDVAERETTPPYPYPLRGVQISIRVHDLSTRQVRQFSIVSDFTPE